eukprot:scaffold143_cov364-Pavlova_lutheri.AAC.27
MASIRGGMACGRHGSFVGRFDAAAALQGRAVRADEGTGFQVSRLLVGSFGRPFYRSGVSLPFSAGLHPSSGVGVRTFRGRFVFGGVVDIAGDPIAWSSASRAVGRFVFWFALGRHGGWTYGFTCRGGTFRSLQCDVMSCWLCGVPSAPLHRSTSVSDGSAFVHRRHGSFRAPVPPRLDLVGDPRHDRDGLPMGSRRPQRGVSDAPLPISSFSPQSFRVGPFRSPFLPSVRGGWSYGFVLLLLLLRIDGSNPSHTTLVPLFGRVSPRGSRAAS